MATGANGNTVPAGSDVFDVVAAINNLNNSLHGRIEIPAANAAARTALTSTCGWTPTVADPLVVLQTDTMAVWLYNGTSWNGPAPIRQSIMTGTASASLGSSATLTAWSHSTVTAPSNMWTSGAPTRIIAPYDGTMVVSVTVSWGNSTGERYMGIRVNGSTDIALVSGNVTSGASFGPTISGSTAVPLTAGQYIEVMLAQVTGASLTVGTRTYAELR